MLNECKKNVSGIPDLPDVEMLHIWSFMHLSAACNRGYRSIAPPCGADHLIVCSELLPLLISYLTSPPLTVPFIYLVRISFPF